MKKRLLSLSLGLSMIFTNVTAIHAEDSLPSKDPSNVSASESLKKETSKTPQSSKWTGDPTFTSIKAARGGHHHITDVAYSFDFESDPEEAGWTFVDADGDGYNWYYSVKDEANPPYNTPYDGVGLIVSDSYDNDTSEALFPDNWAISPKVAVGLNYAVSFMAEGQDANYAAEKFAVYAIAVTDDSVPSPNDAGWVKIGGDFTATGEYVEYISSLSSFEGQDVRVAIRHYNVSDMFMLNVDAFTVGSTDTVFYTVTFNYNNGTGYTETATTGTDGTLGSLPTAEYAGYSFQGWFTDPTGGEKITEETVFTEDTIVYAHWAEVLFGSYFESDPEEEGWVFVDLDEDGFNWFWSTTLAAYEGSGLIVSQSYSNEDEKALTPDNWAISPKFTVGDGGNVLVKAKGQDPSYAAEIFAFYIIPVTDDSVPSPNDEGWVKISDDFTATGDYASYSANVDAYAGQDVRVAIRHYNITDMFILNIDAFEYVGSKPYTITFNPNGGEVKPTKMKTGPDGTLSSLPVAYRDKFNPIGWFTEADGGEEITTNTVFTKDTVVYAHWERSPLISGTYFESNEDVADWTFIDLDGDGKNWERRSGSDAAEGSGFLYSASYSGGALTPDNWAISPVISVPMGDSSVSLLAGPYSSWYYEEVFALYAIEADKLSVNVNPDDWTKLTEDITITEEYAEYSADLSAFAGKDINIAIRHYNCTDQFALLIDVFEITNDNILHMVEIADDIVGGTVKADYSEAYLGETITLSYKENPGYTFASWNVTDSEGNPIDVTEEGTFVMPDDNVVVSAVFESEEPAVPEFKGTSILLSGQIGLVFYYDLPQIDTYTYDSVDFTITMPNGKIETSSWTYAAARENDGLYGFVCFVNSVQMADEITAVLNYTENGEEMSITDVSSVKDYVVNSAGREEGDLTNAQLLTHAVADFGHYAQIFLSESRGWTIGTDYAEMDIFYAERFNLDDIKASVEAFKPIVEAGEDELASLMYSLSLDSSTTLYIYVNTPSDYTGSVEATCNGDVMEAEMVGKSYRFAIPDIKASDLAETYEVIIASDNERAAVTASALSYVYTIVNGDFSENAWNAASAFYKYYEASLPYRMNPRN